MPLLPSMLTEIGEIVIAAALVGGLNASRALLANDRPVVDEGYGMLKRQHTQAIDQGAGTSVMFCAAADATN